MDTNVALWSLAAPEGLSDTVRQLLENPRQRVYFSSISVAKFELKRERLLSDHDGLAAKFAKQLVDSGFTAIPFTAADAAGLAAIKPNRDPFDRMLCAQAIAHSLKLLAADRDLLNCISRFRPFGRQMLNPKDFVYGSDLDRLVADTALKSRPGRLLSKVKLQGELN